MPDDDLLDDESIESLLGGRGSGSVAEFIREISSTAEQPPPVPNAALAAVLARGVSTDKGDLLATAGSNVHGPAEQVAGLPKWRKPQSMFPVTGLLTGLGAKVAAGVMAALAGVAGLGAAGALPGPAQDVVANVIETISPLDVPGGTVHAGADLTSSTGIEAAISSGATSAAGVDAAVNTPAGSTQASVGTGAGASTGGASGGATGSAGASVSTPSLPSVPGLPSLPGVPTLPAVQIPACVSNLVNVQTGLPTVPFSQVSTQVVNCVKTLISSSSTPLPANVSTCVNSILGVVASVGANPGSAPSLTGFNWTQCAPVDATACMSQVLGLLGTLPGGGFGITGSGSAGGSGATVGGSGSGGLNLPLLSGLNLSSCVPFNVDACLSTVFGMAANLPGVATGGIPGLGSGSLPSVGSLNLAACVPFNAIATIPGLGSLSGLLPL
ncbi:MAG: hypothetical protein ACRD12_15590 [Acidimicrobiales bacterium]